MLCMQSQLNIRVKGLPVIRSTVPTLVILLVAANGAAASERPSSYALLDVTAKAAVSEAIGRDDPAYRIVRHTEGRLRAANARAGLDAHFGRAGAGIVAGAATAELSIESIGRGAVLRAVSAAQPTSSDNRVELRRDGLVEWYVNGPAGLQHGFTLSERPVPTRDGEVIIGLRVRGDYRVTVNESGDSATLNSERGPTLRYAGLVAYDAEGRELPARMEANASGIRLVVDDTDAAYPIVVDPFIQSSDDVFPVTGATKWFGISVAVEGDTMVAGAWFGDIEYPGDCENGMAYVFERNGSPIWRLVARLQSSRPDPFCWGEDFGVSVAISGDWIAVGSPTDLWLLPGVVLPPDIEDPNEALLYFNDAQGSVFLFQRPAGGWADATETQVLTELDGTELDFNEGGWYGFSVALEGTTLVVGAPLHGGFDSSFWKEGAVYVYENPIDAGWERSAKLVPSDPVRGRRFGADVAISGDTVVVGNFPHYNDMGLSLPTPAYVFEEPLDGWWNVGAETARLTVEGATNYTVAIDDSTIVVGTPYQDRAFLFEKPLGG
jgi:FG-GAP repeat